MKRILLLAAVLPSMAVASTISDFTSQVRWTSRNGQLLYGGPCHATFGTTGVAPTKPLAYTLSCPGYTEARIYIWTQTDLATVGDLPARVTQKQRRSISLLTGEGETLTFTIDPNAE
ncbi:hypothetical protein ACFSHT_06185 [Paraburkholderia silviterrae]|uniref:Uncharacterized protein n=1 Tax=Paraburkholderia silviterrae TaxID=2528715 RepID=A0A4R5MC61_9BURK|nr:hypothetical protein [Paraburkholderia silviterrae]TDG24492.1 hypothetical protein EYW47_07980 [Paraburkholderia silviterrae]